MYGPDEAQSIAMLLLGDKYNISRKELIVNPNGDIEFDYNDIERLKKHEPVQYIIGHTEFLSRRFDVNPNVLIPRGETEELVLKIISDLGADFNGTIVDIGTGSGCIAISLASAMPKAKITAIDISEKAVEVARHNAANIGVAVEFIVADVFQIESIQYDVVVSNPPYVLQSEISQMNRNVVNFEPSNALFVADSNPLIYYRAIAERCYKCNRIYFEINERFGAQTADLLRINGFTNISVIDDIHCKNRICTAQK